MKNNEKYRVVTGEYVGRIGYIEQCSVKTNIMFYPVEGKNPYRVCLDKKDIEKI